MPSLCDQYHPRDWSEIVGQPVVLRKLQIIRNRRGTLAGGNYWLSGLSGTGKSTIADLIANEIAHSVSIHEVCGRNLAVDEKQPCNVAAFRREMSTRGFGPGGRVVIVNEAHTMRKATIEALLDACDQRTLPSHAAWIFTSTLKGNASLFEDYDDAHPLLSRCTKLELTTDGLAFAFAERAQQIARTEGLDFDAPIERYHALLVECELNLREALNRIEAGEMADAAPAYDLVEETTRGSRKLLVARR